MLLLFFLWWLVRVVAFVFFLFACFVFSFAVWYVVCGVVQLWSSYGDCCCMFFFVSLAGLMWGEVPALFFFFWGHRFDGSKFLFFWFLLVGGFVVCLVLGVGFWVTGKFVGCCLGFVVDGDFAGCLFLSVACLWLAVFFLSDGFCVVC